MRWSLLGNSWNLQEHNWPKHVLGKSSYFLVQSQPSVQSFYQEGKAAITFGLA